MKRTSKNKCAISLTGYPGFPVFSQPKLPTQKAQAVLLYLVGERLLFGTRTISKEKLVDLLWEGMPSTSALQNLRQTIYQIRKTYHENVKTFKLVDEDLILTDRKSIWISENVHLQTDLDWYYAENDPLFAADYSVEELLTCYQKPFLENFHIPNAPQFDAWIDRCRKKLNEAYCSRLESELESTEQARPNENTLLMLQQLIRIEPYAEKYRYHHIKALTKLGKRDRAIQEYRHYEQRLQKDLNLAPSQKLKQLFLPLEQERRC